SGFPSGQYFYIQSVINGAVLDVAGASTKANAEVVLYEKKTGDNDNQLWYADDGFLVNKKSNMVLDVRGGSMKSEAVIIQYDRKNQKKFSYGNGFIYPTANHELVLDIKGEGKKDGTNIILYKRKQNKNDNQQWTLVSAGYTSSSIQNASINSSMHNTTGLGYGQTASTLGYRSKYGQSNNTPSSTYGKNTDNSSYGNSNTSSGYGRNTEKSSYGQANTSSGYGKNTDSSSYGDSNTSSGYGRNTEKSSYGQSNTSSGYGRNTDSSSYGDSNTSSGYG
ncbi:carbohydrate-binding module family 13 protein, partial [Backusella circina FSU 941]